MKPLTAGWAAINLGPLAIGGRLQQFPGGSLPTLKLLLEACFQTLT
jgi:hypothetical protein